MSHSPHATSRVAWVDVAKGISIILVVMMHSTLGVELAMDARGWMGSLVEFARPFRIPCFMLVSGLFLHRTINSPWGRYLDRKVLHFAYFYVLWLTIQTAAKTPLWMSEGQSPADIATSYFASYVQPFGTLWFIYLLPVFFLVTRLTNGVSWRWILAAAIVLELAPIHTGLVVVDEFASRFVYFYAGYALSRHFFALSAWASKAGPALVGLLGLWALANAATVYFAVPDPLNELAQRSSSHSWVKMADLPMISLVLGLAGACAVIAISAWIAATTPGKAIRWVGERSIVVYLAFFLPMAATRIVLIRFFGEILGPGEISALVTAAGVIGPLLLYGFIQFTNRSRFLFERPRWARLEGRTRSLTEPQPAR